MLTHINKIINKHDKLIDGQKKFGECAYIQNIESNEHITQIGKELNK